MIRVVFRKALGDLRTRPGQALLVFLVIALAVSALTVGLSVRRSASEPFARLIERANGPHVWFYRGDAEQFKAIADLDGVAGSSRFLSAAGFNAVLEDSKPSLFLLGLPDGAPAVGSPLLLEGRLPVDGARPEIVIDSGLATASGLKAGDRLDVIYDQGVVRFEIVGVGVPTHMPPYPAWEAPGYVTESTLIALGGDQVRGRLALRLDDPATATAFLDRVDSMFPRELPVRPLGYTWELVRSEVSSISQFYQMTFLLYGILGALTGGLLIANSIAAQILSQQREIGVLKAIGLRPFQVAVAVAASALVVAIAGVAAGIALGLAAVPIPLRQISESLGTATPPVADPATLAVIAVSVMLVIGVAVGFAAWRAARVSTVAAIHAGAARSSGRPSKLAGALKPWLGPLLVLGVRDALSRPVRSALLTLSIAIAVVTTVITLGFDHVFTNPATWPRAGLPHFDLLVAHAAGDSQEAERIVAAQGSVTSYYRWTPSCAGLPGDTECEYDLRVLSGDFSRNGFHFFSGGMIARAGDAAVSWGFAQENGIEPGDQLTLIIEGNQVAFSVSGLYAEAYEGGETITIAAESLPEAVLRELAPARFAVSIDRPDRATDVAADLRRESGDTLIIDVTSDSMALVSDQFRPIALALNGGLVGIAIVNLVSTLLVGVRERYRDMAVLKSVGLVPVQVMSVVLLSVGALALAGVVAGIPLGLYASGVMLDWIAVESNIGPSLRVMPEFWRLAVLVPMAIAVALVTTWVPARRAAGVKVAETLRHE